MLLEISAKKMTKEIFLTLLICLILKSTSMQFVKKVEIPNRVNNEKNFSNKFWFLFLRIFSYHSLLIGFSSMLPLYRDNEIDIPNQWTGFYVIVTLDSNG